MKIGSSLKRVFCCLLVTTILCPLLNLARPSEAQAAGSYSVAVGQTLTLNWSTSKILNSATWTTNASSNIQIVNSSNFSCNIKGLTASNSTFLVQCTYYYWVTSGSYNYLMKGTEDFYVKVYAPNPTGISLPASCSVQVGQSTVLTPVVTPSSAQTTFTWSSSNPAVASVSGGTVTGKDVGTTVITATTQNGLSAFCTVTVPQPPMILSSSTPINNSINVDCGTTITAVFPSALSQGQAFTGIKLTKTSDGSTVQGTAAISGNNVVFTPSKRMSNGVAYKLTIPVGAVTNKWGTSNSSAFTINLTTVALDIVSTTPANASMGVAANSRVGITFNLNISAGSAYASITLAKSSNGNAVAFTPAISGATLSITPNSTLEYNTKYRLTVPSGALINANGVSYQRSVTLDFTTDLAPGTFAGGNGTATSPYLITTQTQLDTIRSYPGAHYALSSDIALSGNWIPIGTADAPFTGSFDGKGHSITNLTMTVTTGEYAGLFGRCNNATLRNLWVKTSTDGVNAVANQIMHMYAGILAGYGQMTVEKCHTEGKIIFNYNPSSNYGFTPYYGGLVGWLDFGSITDCSSSADVTITTKGYYYIGGLVGFSRGLISNCEASGQVSATLTSRSSGEDGYIGGLLGNGGVNCKINNSTASGKDGKGVSVNISSGFGFDELFAGGFVGDCADDVTNCSATNSVSLSGTAIDGNSAIRYLHLGGFAGRLNNNAAVTNCFSTAAVNASTMNPAQTFLKVGGFAGKSDAGVALNRCYSIGNVSAYAKTTINYQNAIAVAAGFIADSASSVSNSYSTGSASAQAAASTSTATLFPTAAGFIGSSSGNITNCYSTGKSQRILGTSSPTAGNGFINSSSRTPLGCYYDSTTSECSDAFFAAPKSTAEMSQPATFSGWDFNSIWVMNGQKSPYPIFQDKYTVTFNSQGGSAIATKTSDPYTAITAPAAPARAGYTFNGWYTAPTGGGKVTFPYTVTSNVTLCAQWTAINYSISYNLNGGIVGSTNPNSYTVASAAMTLANPKKTGYTFTGWSGTGITGSILNVVIPKNSTGNRSYTANWRANIYTVTYNGNGATGGSTASNSHTYGVSKALTGNGFAKTGYTFVGWATSATGAAAYVNSQSVTNLSQTDRATVVLYVKWMASKPATVKAASASYNSVTVSWTACAGASGYEISRATSATGKYTVLGTSTTLTYPSTGLTTGTTYYYKVRAYGLVGTTKVYGGYSAVVSAKPLIVVTAASSSYNSVKLTWRAVAGAASYEISRSTSASGSFTVVGKPTTASFSNSSLTTGTVYYYRVRSYNGTTKAFGPYSPVVSVKPVPATATGVAAARASSTSIKVTWTAVSGANGYEVSRSTSSTFTSSAVSLVTANTFTGTSLKTGTTYYYRVRAYRVVNSAKIYGIYSAIVSSKP